MGSSSYDYSYHTDRLDTCRRTGADYFKYSADIASGAVDSKVHDLLNPSKVNKVGKNIRESFDSDAHPNSLPIAVIFDVTGSMSSVPRQFVGKLNNLMASLTKKGYVADPHILFGAYGDATCDSIPLQIGQFEAGSENTDILAHIHLEGGGGAHIYESAELAMYFMANHTDLDSVNKRGKKGYLFFAGDELPREQVDKKQVKTLIGDTLQENLETNEVFEALCDKFEVFWIIPAETSHTNDSNVIDPLKKMFGQRLLRLKNPEDIVELIVSTIGLEEGYDINDIKKDLADVGADKDAINRASMALSAYKPSSAVVKTATVKGKLEKSKKASSVELV